MEDAGLPGRIPFYRPDRPFIAQMVGTIGQPVRPPRTMGNGAQPMEFYHKIPKRLRQFISRHFLSPTNTYLRNFKPERLVPPPNEDRRRRS